MKRDLVICNIGTTILKFIETVSHIYTCLDRHADNEIGTLAREQVLQEQV